MDAQPPSPFDPLARLQRDVDETLKLAAEIPDGLKRLDDRFRERNSKLIAALLATEDCGRISTTDPEVHKLATAILHQREVALGRFADKTLAADVADLSQAFMSEKNPGARNIQLLETSHMPPHMRLHYEAIKVALQALQREWAQKQGERELQEFSERAARSPRGSDTTRGRV